MKIALIGCGNWGRNILRDLRTLDPGGTIAVLARGAASKEHAMNGGANVVVDHPDDIERFMKPDGVIIAVPSTLHAEAAAAMYQQFGCPVFIEKPLAVSTNQAASLSRFPTAKFFVMDKWRYHPGVEAIRDIAKSGDFGRVVGLRTLRVGWGDRHSDTDAIWHLVPHDLAIGLEILGNLPEVRGSAVDRPEDERTGIVGILGREPWFVLEISNRTDERRRKISLYCEKAVITLADAYSDHIRIVRGKKETTEMRRISKEMPLKREIDAFLNYLRGGPRPKSEFEEAYTIVQRIEELVKAGS